MVRVTVDPMFSLCYGEKQNYPQQQRQITSRPTSKSNKRTAKANSLYVYHENQAAVTRDRRMHNN